MCRLSKVTPTLPLGALFYIICVLALTYGWILAVESSSASDRAASTFLRGTRGMGNTCDSPEVPRNIVIIGAGPTGLGAALRLSESKHLFTGMKVTVMEQEGNPGGLASSERDRNGFLWDMGGHVVFSHYEYFDRVLDEAIGDWNHHERAAFSYMRGSDGVRRFIPYPVQNSIHDMAETDRERCLSGLRQVVKKTHDNDSPKPSNFDEWLMKNFGEGLCDVFMRKYNKKIWTVETSEMSSLWVGERVSVPDIGRIELNILKKEQGFAPPKSAWGPNRVFRFPRYNGTMSIWRGVADMVPSPWFRYESRVVGIDTLSKRISVVSNSRGKRRCEYIPYDVLISTAPLDVLMGMIEDDGRDSDITNMKNAATSGLVYTHTHVVGVGVSGQPPQFLLDKTWIYFPDSDSPFYRVTLFSKYSDDHVPDPALQWSLMCESAEPLAGVGDWGWTDDTIVQGTIDALVLYGFIAEDMVVSRYHRRLDHGYPVPTLGREAVLASVQPWLETVGVFSRGRFGGWKYEVGNQDHSLMQGVEVVDRVVRGIPEETYPIPSLVNSMRGSDRFLEDSRISQDSRKIRRRT